MDKKLKIGVVGAGPAGSFSALLLARAGHEVVMIEKRSEITRKLCGEYLCPKGVELLESYQLKSDPCQGFLDLQGMVLASPEEIVVKCSFPETQTKWRGLSVNRKIFDQKLLEEARESGVQIQLDTTVNSLKKLNKGWLIQTSKGEFIVDLLIAADGRVSSVAKMLGHSDKIDTSRVAVHFFLPRKSFKGLRYGEMHIFHDGSYCGIDPVNDEEVNVSFVFDAAKIRGTNLHDLSNLYIKKSKRLYEMFGEITSAVEIKAVTPLTNKNSFIAGNSLAYVGDASGFIDPLTGEGIYNALLSAHLLFLSLKKEHSLEEALKDYRKTKIKVQLQKKILNQFFQYVIKKPALSHLIAKFIQKKSKRADYFIGIIGNIYSPLVGIAKMLFA